MLIQKKKMISSQALKKEYHSSSQEYIYKSLHYYFEILISNPGQQFLQHNLHSFLQKSFLKKVYFAYNNCFLPSSHRSIADFFCECAQFQAINICNFVPQLEYSRAGTIKVQKKGPKVATRGCIKDKDRCFQKLHFMH